MAVSRLVQTLHISGETAHQGGVRRQQGRACLHLTQRLGTVAGCEVVVDDLRAPVPHFGLAFQCFFESCRGFGFAPAGLLRVGEFEPQLETLRLPVHGILIFDCGGRVVFFSRVNIS